eukprot:11485217-Prorocentrum_lima.AAC.1
MKPCTVMIASKKFNNSTAPAQLFCSINHTKTTVAVLQCFWSADLSCVEEAGRSERECGQCR